MILTADLIARAIIASSRTFGDDPLASLTARGGPGRRAVIPAALGLSRAANIPQARVCAILGLHAQNVCRSRERGAKRFELAMEAAREAVAYSLRMDALQAKARAAVKPRPPAPEIAKSAAQIIPRIIPAPRVSTAAPPSPKPIRPPAGRQFARGTRFESLGDGVQVVRLKPITETVLRHARAQHAKGAKVTDLADLFDVDADHLANALQVVA